MYRPLLTLRIMLNEIYKRLLILWDYKFDTLMQLLVIALIFLGAAFFLGKGQFSPALLPAQLLGYAVWLYARIVIISTSVDMIGEAQAGTLEQMYMSPLPSEMLLLSRLIALLLSTTIMMLLTIGSLLLVLGIHLPLRWESFVILFLTLVGLFGFTLTLSGIALLAKQVNALGDMIQNLLLFLTGSLVPISLFPTWLALFARTLPITQGIIVLRNVTLNNQSFSAAWSDGSLSLLFLHSVLYLLGGWLIFKFCEYRARRQGSLGQY